MATVMSLKHRYEAFLGAPTVSALADEASLHYVPTLTTVHDAPNIVKRLTALSLKRREEKILGAVESQQALVAEVETCIEFVSDGGAYLPGLDDNFLADRVVTLLVVHIVHFDREQKIRQVRLHWDQASLLRDVDIIGARSKNWPIHPGLEQARLVASGLKVAVDPEPPAPAQEKADASTTATNGDHQETPKDPRASRSLVTPAEPEPETPRPTSSSKRSGKPAARRYDELFMGGESDTAQSPVSKGTSFAGGPQSAERASPRKAGLARNYQPSRLFAENGGAPDRKENGAIKPSSKRFDHFDFGDGTDETAKPKRAASPSKLNQPKHHLSQWDFEDFVTPDRRARKVRGQDVRHFGWSDDEVNMQTPAQPKRAGHARRDVETHFEFKDDSTPQPDKQRPAARARGSSHNQGLGLYQDNVGRDEDGASAPVNIKTLPLGNVTNINNHRKNFDDHFSMGDVSPRSSHEAGKGPDKKKKALAPNRQAAVNMMDSQWDRYEEFDEELAAAANNNNNNNNHNHRHNDNHGNSHPTKNDQGKRNTGVTSESQTTAEDDDDEDDNDKEEEISRSKRSSVSTQQSRASRHIVAAGLERHWAFGDESPDNDFYGTPNRNRNNNNNNNRKNNNANNNDENMSPRKNQHQRQQSRASTATSGKSFWDF